MRLKTCSDDEAIRAIEATTKKRLARAIAHLFYIRGYLKHLRRDVWDDRPKVVEAIKRLEMKLSRIGLS